MSGTGLSGGDGFRDRLAITVKLSIGGKEHAIKPGDVKRLDLDLWSWGHEGLVEFFVADNKKVKGGEKDSLLADFLKPDLAEVTVEVKAVLSDLAKKPAFTSLKVKGLVVDKTLVELPIDEKYGQKLLFRRYGVRFSDHARALWRQHHPCVLYTHKTVKDVIDAHKGSKIAIKYDWDAELTKELPMFFLGLTPDRGASFYDFLMWFVRDRNGVFSYDYSTQEYKLSAAKASSGKPLPMRESELDQVRIIFPEVIRHQSAILNSYTEGTRNEAVKQDHAVAGVRHDVLLTTPIGDEIQARVNLEKARLKSRGLELELSFCRFPATAILPGALVDVKKATGLEEAGVAATQEVFRTKQLELRATSVRPGPHDDHLAANSEYQLALRTRSELKAETFVPLPAFVAPRYPLHVEGIVVSEQGAAKDETWQVYTDSKTSQDQYKIKIPLWKNQIITVPFNPNLLPGQFYFPAYKDQRVLVSLGLRNAHLKRFLDWRSGARLPGDTQGVHMLTGKTTKSGTSLSHFYEDGKPVFRIKRTNAKDTSKIEIHEGLLQILVKEETS